MVKTNSPRFLTSRLIAVSVLLVLHAVPALAADQTTLSATVSVLPIASCAVTVTPPTDMTFTMNWSPDTGIQVTSASKAPRNLTVKAAADTGCSLNTLSITTTSNGARSPGGSGNFSLRVPLTSNTGYWRFMPYLARAQFYLDDNATQEGTGKITYQSPSPFSLTFQSTPKYAGGDTDYLAVMGEDPGGAPNSLFMTDEYVESGGALLIDGDNHTGSFSSSNATETYKSAILGIGVLVATGPENAAGGRDDTAAQPGDTATMTWTITVSAA